MGHNGNINLSCKANQLNAQQIASYKWKWMFKNERELTHVYGKYEILSAFSSLDSCKQRKGSVYLHVRNVTREDLGTYKCVLLQSNTVVAAEDIPFYQQGMLAWALHSYTVRCKRLYIELSLFSFSAYSWLNTTGNPQMCLCSFSK